MLPERPARSQAETGARPRSGRRSDHRRPRRRARAEVVGVRNQRPCQRNHCGFWSRTDERCITASIPPPLTWRWRHAARSERRSCATRHTASRARRCGTPSGTRGRVADHSGDPIRQAAVPACGSAMTGRAWSEGVPAAAALRALRLARHARAGEDLGGRLEVRSRVEFRHGGGTERAGQYCLWRVCPAVVVVKSPFAEQPG